MCGTCWGRQGEGVRSHVFVAVAGSDRRERGANEGGAEAFCRDWRCAALMVSFSLAPGCDVENLWRGHGAGLCVHPRGGSWWRGEGDGWGKAREGLQYLLTARCRACRPLKRAEDAAAVRSRGAPG